MDIYVASMSWLLLNNASMIIGVHASFQIIVFSGYMPRRGLWDHRVVLYSNKQIDQRNIVGSKCHRYTQM